MGYHRSVGSQKKWRRSKQEKKQQLILLLRSNKGLQGNRFYIKELEKDIVEIKGVSERVGVLKVELENGVILSLK